MKDRKQPLDLLPSMAARFNQRMRLCLVAILLTGLSEGQVFAQTGQIDISKVTKMPKMPSPYIMRDWKKVAIRYDSLIFSLNATGTYFPVMKLKLNGGVNYPLLQPILLDSYVGSLSNGTQAEAINIIPAIVGASLVGVNKSSQNGTDWTIKVKDFFNKANGQNVYLNSYSSTSGSDWWYDLMPNVFFYQLYSQYPTTQDFGSQFITVADRWLGAVNAMGGSTMPWTLPQMNYRAFNLATMTPNSNDVSEPESAGTIAWLLYHAYLKTGNKKYLEGAQQAMGFLSGLNFDPAYEIQLPYGSFIAAKMNAELGTKYDVEKMINWSFNQSAQRNWGTIVGNWGGKDVSGLVGEVNDSTTGYAFTMNGFEQAAALVPLVKYDKRFARSIAKWVLNLANASRLFYPQYLPQSNQDDFNWSSANDPHSVIAYEALKQNWNNTNLYGGTGDAVRNMWAHTNLGLYGSSHVGYLAALVDTTNAHGILLLDVNKTDFFGQNAFPSYLVYNPGGSSASVTLQLGANTFDIYDAISEKILFTGAAGNFSINAPSDSVLFLVYLPQGATPVAKDGKYLLGNNVVDYHYGYHFSGKLRIKSLDAADTLVQFNQKVPVYSSIENATGAATFNWYLNGAPVQSSLDSLFNWTVPQVAGQYELLLKVKSGADSVQDSLHFHVVQHIPVPPVVTGITMDSTWYSAGSTATLICHASNAGGGLLEYQWSVTGGTIVDQTDSLIHWRAPQNDGLFPISCKVTNLDLLATTVQQPVLVKKRSASVTAPFAYYPFDGDVRDYSGNGRDAVLQGVQLTSDSRGEPNKAYSFSSSSDVIYVNNDAGLNFQDQITLSFWVKLDAVTQESYALSHGSYEERWKVSVLQNNKLRWTVKTTTSTKDLDSSFPLLLNHFYHFAVVYTGYSMELYADGMLDTFMADSGPMATAAKEVTFGKKDLSTGSYHLNGTLDEVRIYDQALAPGEIATLKTLWNNITETGHGSNHSLGLYPNPSHGILNVIGIDQPVANITLMDVTGRKINATYSYLESDNVIQIEFSAANPGMLIVKIETATGVIYRKVMVF